MIERFLAVIHETLYSFDDQLTMLKFVVSLCQHRYLLWRLTEREVLGRYKGSFIGIGWSLINPLAMLAVYTFIFSQVFKARWGGAAIEPAGPLSFSVNLFAGLIVFNFFSECVSKSPTLITDNPNYVKKVVFPLEILGASIVASSAFHAFISLIVLLIFRILVYKHLPPSALLIPIVWVPLLLGALALTWLLSSAGVFFRDIGQITNLLLNITLYLSPIFYPISALPSQWHFVLRLNPLTSVIEQTRQVIVQGSLPNVAILIFMTLGTIGLCEVSFVLFQKSKRAFADVL